MEEEKKNPYADIKEFLSRWDVLKTEAKYSRITILVLSVLLVIMFCFVMNKNTVVTVIPYTLSSEAYITQDKASVRYKEAWGHMIASEIGNISQKNFNFLKSRLAPLVSPSIYGEFFKKLEDEIAQIKEDKIIISFAPAAVVYEPNTDKVFVFGRSEVTNALGYKTSSVRTYEIKIRMNLYVPQIILTGVMMCSAGLAVADDYIDDIPDVPASVMRSDTAPSGNGEAIHDEPMITVKQGNNYIVPIAIAHPNRIVTPFSNPEVISTSLTGMKADGSCSEICIKDNVVYVATNKQVPVTMFVNEKGNESASISLTLVPKKIPPREIALRFENQNQFLAKREARKRKHGSRISLMLKPLKNCFAA